MHKFSDYEILDGIKTGNDNVIQFLIRQYMPQVQRYILRNSGSKEDAEDVLQETLVVLYMKIKKDNISLSYQLGTYLIGIVKIVWLKELKKRSRVNEIDPDINHVDNESDILKTINTRDRQKIYKDYFNQLGKECKELLEYFFKGEKITKITSLMGYNSDQHTKNKKYICKKNLIESIRSNPSFKEIKNDRLNNITEIPRW